MSQKEIIPGSAEDWMRHALSDLELAQIEPKNAILYSDLCFHCQQAAEKAIKAVLVHNQVRFPNTHSIIYLLELLQELLDIAPLVIEASILSDYAVSVRYPGDADEVTVDEWRTALKHACNVVEWARSIIEKID